MPPTIRRSHTTGPVAHLADLSLRVLMCMRVNLQQWTSGNMAAPYWRVYCNTQPGACLLTGGKTVELTPGRLWLIPPDTPYTAELHQPVEHFYLHFTIAASHQSRPGLMYQRELSAPLQNALDELAGMDESPDHAVRAGVLAMQIAAWALAAVPQDHFRPAPKDARVRKALQAMQQDPARPWTNHDLARLGHMNTNAFARLFRQEVGHPPQDHRTRLRIERACELLHTTEDSIDSLAERLGFCDRYHFSRVFKARRGMGPATFRMLNKPGGHPPS